MSCVVSIVVITIDDKIVSMFCVCWNILEVLDVFIVSQDIIRMNSLKMHFGILHAAILEAVELNIKLTVHSMFSKKLFFFNREWFIIFIKAVLILINIFIYLNIIKEKTFAFTPTRFYTTSNATQDSSLKQEVNCENIEP